MARYLRYQELPLEVAYVVDIGHRPQRLAVASFVEDMVGMDIGAGFETFAVHWLLDKHSRETFGAEQQLGIAELMER